ncbi:MAG: hypothetical protein L6R40_007441 [Gallowayella cf. fulva]|nr:MAG: hypothetical protein L6R40_007441 [Xanthomendoza cf. fulva]
MAAQGEPPGSIRPTPGQLQTNGAAMRNQRFSWQETPLDVQRSTFQQFSSPTNSTIDESPISPRDGYRPFPDIPQPQGASQYPVEKPTVDRTASPYHLSGPHGTHPAYFAPVVEEPTQRQPRPQAPAAPQPKPAATTNSEKGREAVRSSPPPAQSDAYPRYPKDGTEIIKADIDKSTPVYNPSSLAGPNATLENHRPGQVAHPNAAVEPDWKHGLLSNFSEDSKGGSD